MMRNVIGRYMKSHFSFSFVFALLAMLFLSVKPASAQTSNDTQRYIEQYRKAALEQEKLYGIPATITLAQGILESSSGKSMLTVKANNHFGVKAGKSWTGPIFQAWDDEPQKSRFRHYASASESFRDHSLLLANSSRYKSLFTHSVFDYRSWANGLQKCGYATAKHYAQALIGIIDTYRLYTVNGGVKLRAGKTVTIVRYTQDETPVFDEECQMDEDEDSEEQESVSRTLNRYMVENNGVRCTILYPGQTLSSIAMKYDIEQGKLLEFNEIKNADKLDEGDIVYLEKKKTKYKGLRDYYRVKEGDTMHSVAQEFGLKVSALAKLNKKNEFSILKEGEKLELK